MSTVKSYHPTYPVFAPSWEICRDFAEGERKVKALGIRYLPPTEGMLLDGMKENAGVPDRGRARYESYKMRARVPDYVGSAVEVMTGLMHAKPPIIQLPESMEYLRDKASSAGERLGQLYRRMTMEQITVGRLGLLPDMPAVEVVGGGTFMLSLYKAESIINWDDGTDMEQEASLQLVVLDESGVARKTGQFDWEYEERFRVLQKLNGTYHYGVFEGVDSLYAESDMREPKYRNRPASDIPFVFINSSDLLAHPQQPPLLRLAELCHGIYMSEADYRQQLHSQGQDTLVVTGGVRNSVGDGTDDVVRVGVGARIDLDVSGDAKYIGISTEGIVEARTAIESDRKRAQVKSGELIQNNGSQMESGTALSTRFNAQTATLNQLAKTCAAGLESALRQIAIWMGEDPKAVQVEPNLEFVDFAIEGQNMYQLMQAKGLGFPISYRSLHELAADRGLTTTDFETEISRIKEEEALGELLIATPPAPATPPQNNPAPNDGGGE